LLIKVGYDCNYCIEICNVGDYDSEISGESENDDDAESDAESSEDDDRRGQRLREFTKKQRDRLKQVEVEEKKALG